MVLLVCQSFFFFQTAGGNLFSLLKCVHFTTPDICFRVKKLPNM